MLYQTYQLHDDLIAPFRCASRWARSFVGPLALPSRRQMGAALELISRYELSHARPGFDIGTVEVGNRQVPVTEEVVLDLPFGKLLHFSKDIDTPQPRLLVAAPLSGHFATLLRGTRGDAPARPRRLRHRLGQRPRGAGRGRPLRRRGLRRLPDPLPRGDRPRRPRPGRLPALRPDPGRGRRDVRGPQSGDPALDDADGRPDRHPRKPDGGQRARRLQAARLVRAHADLAGPLALRRPRTSGLSRASCSSSPS